MCMTDAFNRENALGAKQSPHQDGAGVVPDGMLDIDDRLDQGHEAKVALKKAEQGSIPAAITSANQPKLKTAERAEQGHELTQLGDTLSEGFAVADKVCRDGQFAIEIAARSSRIVKREMRKNRVPTTVVQPARDPKVTVVIGAHQGMQ